MWSYLWHLLGYDESPSSPTPDTNTHIKKSSKRKLTTHDDDDDPFATDTLLKMSTDKDAIFRQKRAQQRHARKKYRSIR